MRNFEDAAILSRQNIDELPIDFLVGTKEELEQIRKQPPMEPFSDETMEFLGKVADRVKKSGRRDLSDLVTFSFWCRPAHLRQLKETCTKEEIRLGRGVSLHFAPGNIPTQFAYSAVAALLAGNCVLVRLSRNRTVQEEILLRAFRETMEREAPFFRGRVLFFRYAHREEVTQALSSLCDVRVIWGSNESVRAIRQASLPAGAIDLPFAARKSAAVFDSSLIRKETNLMPICRAFYNDTYLNDQNACSSPNLIYWLGTPEETDRAKKRFWGAFGEVLTEKGWQVQAETAVRKLTAACMAAVRFPDVGIEKEDNRILRMNVKKAEPALWNFTEPGGFFVELEGEDLSGLFPILGRICQTLSYAGLDPQKLGRTLKEKQVTGVDRIVPVGHTLDFSLTWDGFDLIEAMSRKIEVS